MKCCSDITGFVIILVVPQSLARRCCAGSAQPNLLHHVQNAGAGQRAGREEIVASLTFQTGYQLTHMSREVVSRGHFRHRAQARVPETFS